MLNDDEIMDGNAFFEYAQLMEISEQCAENHLMIRSFIRSALDPGLIDPNMPHIESENTLALMNLLMSIRWFVEVWEEKYRERWI